MRVAQLIIQKLLDAAVLAAGVYIVAQEMGYWADREALSVPENRLGAYVVGILLILVGLIAVLPPLRFRRKPATISFPGEHGDVLIHLDSVQANLNKVVGKRPEVKRSHVKVIPVADKRRVRLEADVLLNKTPDAGARELAEKLRKFIATTAANMLGIDEVATVDLNVRGIIVDKGVVKAMVAKEEPEKVRKPAASIAERLPGPDATHEPAGEPMPQTIADAPAATPADEPEFVEPEVAPGPDEPVLIEPERLPDEEPALSPLSGWEEPATPAPGPDAQADIATPAAEDLNEEPTLTEDTSAQEDEEPRDKSLFP